MLVVFSVRKTNICQMPLLKLMPFATSAAGNHDLSLNFFIRMKKKGEPEKIKI